MTSKPELVGEQRLTMGAPPASSPHRRSAVAATTIGLAEAVLRGESPILVAGSERRADDIARALPGFLAAEAVEILVLPPWDCLPFELGGPTRECQGRRLAVLAALSRPADTPRVLVTSPAAVVTKIPPMNRRKAHFSLELGQRLDQHELVTRLEAFGYLADDRVDDAGEFAVRAEVIDLFPAAAERPVRLDLDADQKISALRPFDPATQLSEGEMGEVHIHPVEELRPEAPDSGESLFDLFDPGVLQLEPGAADACQRQLDQVEEAWNTAVSFGGEGPVGTPTDLYLPRSALDQVFGRAVVMERQADDPPPQFATELRRGAAIADYVFKRRAAGDRVVFTGLPHEIRAMLRVCRRQLGESPVHCAAWLDVLDAEPGALLSMAADIGGGLVDSARSLVVLTPVEILGARMAERRPIDTGWMEEPDFSLGDVVLHEDHGMGVLEGLERLVTDEVQQDVLRIAYAGGSHVLAPVEELNRIWRYGSEPTAVTLDRLGGQRWGRKKAALARHVEAAAAALVARAEARAAEEAPVIVPPRTEFARLSTGFPYPESPDQSAAIEAVLEDLKSGRPMHRLVCGDVGFGKTEVALRAAGAVALTGRQVLLVAPTTVLARQHHAHFQRRFAGTGVRVEQLSRLVSEDEAERVRAELAEGSVGVVIGTQQLASEALQFADLGLVVIDEEHRFGADLKAALSRRAAHVLALSATPIPRTLQGALVGVQDVSIIATPPARRRPIRTFISALDGALVRTALLREKARRGQSFIVTARIEDLEPLRRQLETWVPELTVRTAHGRMEAEGIDDAMFAFAQGATDVLLATNIIENGLDVPRANTILIHHPERFGLAQLHQLRGRVGRGRRQGVAYLLSPADAPLGEAARGRLATLEAFDRLGAGFLISARDLDLRGGGNLVGDDQAGHRHAVASGLYNAMMERAVSQSRDHSPGVSAAPEVNLARGWLPETYVADMAARINLYARLARLRTVEDAEDLAAEIEDRFGSAPDPVRDLLDHARLSALALASGVTRISVGPKGSAYTLSVTALGPARARAPANESREWKEDRLIVSTEGEAPHDLAAIEATLLELTG